MHRASEGTDNGRVLVVDDDPRARTALARALRDNGIVAVVAATAEEAIALAQDDSFGSVVTDLKMPGIGGVSMLQRLSPTQPGARFVVLTDEGPLDPSVFPEGHSMSVLQKPWCLDQLLGLVLGTEAVESSVSSTAPPDKRSPHRVLLVEDNRGDAVLFQHALESSCADEFVVTHVTTLEAALCTLQAETFDVITLDTQLPDGFGLSTIARMQAAAPDVGLVILSGRSDEEFALKAVQFGAQDYLVKGHVEGAAIGKALRYAEERKRVEQRLAAMAFHDQLTGLANRTLFRQRVAQAVAYCRRTGGHFAVLLLDMDHFKDINDAFGHDAGDAFLQEVAARLRRASRETDTIARLGGDEFAILAQPLAAPHDVRAFADRILTELRRPLELFGNSVVPTASIGVATYPYSGEDSDALLASADTAMYVVKSEGRNAVHVHGAELTQLVARRAELGDQLTSAVETKDFVMFYQWQVTPGSRSTRAEAFLRWTRAQADAVPAADFVAMLEERGLIVDLGAWVFETVCGQLKQWRDDGYQVERLAVNVSLKELTKKDAAAHFGEVVQSAGVQASDIEFEVTEGAVSAEVEAAAVALQALTERGFRLALDNFGASHASLSLLRTLPFDTLKIDRELLVKIGTDARQRAFVGGVIQLARRLALDVVANGVEDEAQARFLREEGCTALQGFHFGPALPAGAFESKVLARRLSV